jgi:hypothetical protein
MAHRSLLRFRRSFANNALISGKNILIRVYTDIDLYLIHRVFPIATILGPCFSSYIYLLYWLNKSYSVPKSFLWGLWSELLTVKWKLIELNEEWLPEIMVYIFKQPIKFMESFIHAQNRSRVKIILLVPENIIVTSLCEWFWILIFTENVEAKTGVRISRLMHADTNTRFCQ